MTHADLIRRHVPGAEPVDCTGVLDYETPSRDVLIVNPRTAQVTHAEGFYRCARCRRLIVFVTGPLPDLETPP